MKNWPEIRDQGWLKLFLERKRSTYVWTRNFDGAYTGLYTIWDYQWLLTLWTQAGLSIHPKVNLVSNIGFGQDATHTSDAGNSFANFPVSSLSFPMRHPSHIVRNTSADLHLQNTVFDPSKINKALMLFRKLKYKYLSS